MGISWSPMCVLKGVKPPVEFGERTRDWTPGHAGKEVWRPVHLPSVYLSGSQLPGSQCEKDESESCMIPKPAQNQANV